MVKTNTPIICLRQISAVFSDMQVLSHVDLAIYPGEFHGIIGKNGAGKAVPANILSGNRKPDQGEVLLAPVRAYAENETRNITTGKFPAICACTLRNDAGVIGAAALENSI